MVYALVHALSGLFHLATESCSCSSTGALDLPHLPWLPFYLFIYLLIVFPWCIFYEDQRIGYALMTTIMVASLLLS